MNKSDYKELIGQLDKYVTYYYYPRNKSNNEMKIFPK